MIRPEVRKMLGGQCRKGSGSNGGTQIGKIAQGGINHTQIGIDALPRWVDVQDDELQELSSKT